MYKRKWSSVVAALCAATLIGVAVSVSGAGASPVPVAAGGRRPQTPSVSGRYAVWADRQGGSYDILMFDAYTGITQAVSSSSADEIQPAIQGDRVVYTTYVNGNPDIYLYDIPSGIVSPVCVDPGTQVNPSIWGNIIVWEDTRGIARNPGIYGYDLSTHTEFSIESGYNRPKKRPRVAGDVVVWEDYSGQAVGRTDADVRFALLSTGVKTTLTDGGNGAMVPSTDGRYIVWAQTAAGGLDIRAYDTVTGVYTNVRRQAGEQTLPSIGDGTVYWIDNSGGPRLHLDAFSLPQGKYLAFDDRGTGDIGGVSAQGAGLAWLERNANRWQVRVLAGSAPGLGGLGVGAASYVSNPLRVRTAVPADGVAPTVASASVSDGSKNVSAGAFTLYFSEPLDPGTAESGVQLTDTSGSTVSAEVTYSAARKSLTVRPKVKLVSGTYSLRVSPALSDKAGNKIGTVPPVTFSTGPEMADSTPPAKPAHPAARVDGLTNVTVSWDPVSDSGGSGLAGYRVYRYQWVTGTPSLVASFTGAATSVTFGKGTTETTPAKYTYYYGIRAVDGSGNVGATSALCTPDPHGTYIAGYDIATCSTCHEVHGAGGGGALGAQSASACYDCHGSTPATRDYGIGSTFDVQGNFGDDAVIATVGPQYVDRYVHRNTYMASIQRECDGCHTPHRRAATTVPDPSLANGWNKLLRSQVTTAPAGYRYNSYASAVANDFCFDCHGSGAGGDDSQTKMSWVGGAGAYTDSGGDHRTSWNVAYNRHAGVAYVASTSANPGIQCTACHDQHGSPADSLLGQFDPADGKWYIGSVEITANNYSVCYGCHTSATVAKSVTASGYPVDGTWPGKTSYTAAYNGTTHTGSMHGTGSPNATSSAFPAAGDCRMCHDIHGTANRYDILVGGTTTTPNYSPATAGFCFAGCHDGSRAVVDDDIERYWPVAAGGTSAEPRSGHRTLSGGVLPAGSALPCYYCHNPHGSGSSYGLMVVTRDNNATITVGDVAGEIDMTGTPTPASVREFCFTCHTTADTTEGWNGSAYDVVQAPALVAGIDRTTYNATGAHLKLPPVSGHYAGDSASSCYTCHGRDYALPTSNNVHSPAGGGSSGGSPCYTCHQSYKDTMDMNGTGDTGSYHHVVGTSTTAYTGDLAPNAGAYPITQTDVFCVSCHTDHNYFNSAKGANLRQDRTNSDGSVATNTDFFNSGTYGVCVTCHSTVVDKDTVHQASSANSSTADESTRTMIIAGAKYGASAHNYSVGSSFGPAASDRFNANCSKCHNDEQNKTFASSTYKFGTHYSAARRIVSAFGGTVTDPLEENSCYGCHTGAAAGRDYYGTSGAAMTQASKRVESVFAKTSHHPVDETRTVGTGGPAGWTTTTETWSLGASATVDSGGTWAGDANSLGNSDSVNATSNPSGPFEMWQRWDGSYPDWTDCEIIDATITVRSRAMQDGWGASTPPGASGQVTLTATSDVAVLGTVDSGTGSSIAPWYDDIEEYPENDADFYSASANNSYPIFGFTAPSLPAGATNISVTVYWRAGDEAAGVNAGGPRLRVNALDYTGTSADPGGTGFTAGSEAWTTNPGNGGAAWTAADINGTSATPLQGYGYGTTSDSNPDINVSQCYVVVTYDVAGVTNDDKWGIEYSTDAGSSWTTITDASSTSETVLTNHTLTTLESVLETTNADNFRVRVFAQQQGGSWDSSGTVAWDSSLLEITYLKSTYSAGGSSGTGPAIMCESCHNPHVVTVAGRVTDPSNSYNTTAYASTDEQAAYCLDCHGGSSPAKVLDASTYVPASISSTMSGFDKSAYSARALDDVRFHRFGRAQVLRDLPRPARLAVPEAAGRLRRVRGHEPDPLAVHQRQRQQRLRGHLPRAGLHAVSRHGGRQPRCERLPAAGDVARSGDVRHAVQRLDAHGLVPRHRHRALAVPAVAGRRLQELPRRAWHGEPVRRTARYTCHQRLRARGLRVLLHVPRRYGGGRVGHSQWLPGRGRRFSR